MLEGCLKELQRVAPDHYETVRARTLAAGWEPDAGVASGWVAILLLALGTGGHALLRGLRRPSRGRRPIVAAATGLLLAGAALSWSAPATAEDPPGGAGEAPMGAAEPAKPPEPEPTEPTRQTAPVPQPAMPSGHAGMLSDWPVDDKDPESSVPTEARKERNPLQFGYWLMDLTYKAGQATKRGDHPAAIRYYKALAKAVPDRSVPFTRLCESYEAAGAWKDALESCATALTRPGTTVNDYTRYFSVALAKKGSLSATEVDLLEKVIAHLREDPVGRDFADDLQCQLGVRLEEVGLLEPCTAALAAKAPDDPRTISFEWALAMARGDMDEARRMVERARGSTMKPEGVAEMERGMASIEEGQRHRRYAWGFGGLGVLLALAGALVLFARKRGEMQPAETTP